MIINYNLSYKLNYKKLLFLTINREKMDTLEDDITNEKDIISKDEIEKSNSFAKKSVDETVNFLNY